MSTVALNKIFNLRLKVRESKTVPRAWGSFICDQRAQVQCQDVQRSLVWIGKIQLSLLMELGFGRGLGESTLN